MVSGKVGNWIDIISKFQEHLPFRGGLQNGFCYICLWNSLILTFFRIIITTDTAFSQSMSTMMFWNLVSRAQNEDYNHSTLGNNFVSRFMTLVVNKSLSYFRSCRLLCCNIFFQTHLNSEERDCLSTELVPIKMIIIDFSIVVGLFISRWCSSEHGHRWK